MASYMQMQASIVGTELPVNKLALLLGLGALSTLLLGLGIGLVVSLVRSLRRRDGPPPQVGATAITPKRLRTIWESFLSPLPPPVRAALPEHDHFIVLGDPGAGKSALISRRIDWQGQASQFLPSYTPDPLLQIYLGSQVVVEEVSATLQASTSRETHEAFRRLWRASLSDRPPTVIIVLKVSQLGASSPDVIRQQAQLVRGKLNLLADLFKAPIHTRICLTHMDRIRGYSEFARFLRKNRLPLTLEAGADAGGSLTAGLLNYEKYVPRALTMLPVGPFESSVSLLSSAESFLAPVRGFIAALLESSVASVRPDLQRVYFFSLPPEEQVGNPFEAAGLAPASMPTPWSRLSRWLTGLGIQPLHATLCLLLLLGGLLPVGLLLRRHDQRVKQSTEATAEFEKSVRRAQEALSNPSESDVVRRAELLAAQTLSAVESDEARFRLLRLLFHAQKATSRQRFIESVRQGYLRPALESGVRQRARDKILYALAVIYATRENALGAIVRSQPEDFATTLGLPVDLLGDYVNHSELPWSERVLLLLPPLPSEASRFPIADLGPWRDFVQSITQAIPQPHIAFAELDRLRKEADRLHQTIERVRKAAAMRRMFQMLSEESPLDMVKLFGDGAGVLTPDPWLHDNMPVLARLLRLIRESSLELNKQGRMSLYQLLKWINSLSGASPGGRGGSLPVEEDLIHLAFPNGKLYEVSARGWLELLLRSRKRLLLAHRVSSATAGEPPHPAPRADCCECQRRHRRRDHRRCVPCASEEKGSAARRAMCRPHSGSEGRVKMPPFSDAELQPRLARLLTSDKAPDEGLAEEYNRALFDNEVMPLLRELKKALSDSKALSPEEKIKLARLVRKEIDGYAQNYCAALLRFHRSFHFHDGSAEDLHTELLNLVRPGSRFITHLFAVADNASLRGLEDPYLAPLRECLAEFKPLVQVMSSGGDKKGEDKAEGLTLDREPKGLKPYLSAIAKLAEELDAPPGSGTTSGPSKGAQNSEKDDKKRGVSLEAELSPAGRSALAIVEGRAESPRSQAEQFLDKAGIVGPLRQPFIDPFSAVYRRGAYEIERTLARHWQAQTLPMVSSLFTRFPFNQSAEREVAPAELDQLCESSGAFWQDVRDFYAPVLSAQSGDYRAKSGAAGPLALPKEMLPTLGRLASLSRTLFDTSCKRQPLRFTVRGLPGSQLSEGTSVQPTIVFLRVGKSALYGFNQRASAEPFSVDWWNQGVALVGLERSSSKSGRKHTETLEVADSAWSLFRLLQKTTLDSEGVSTWRILGDGPQDGHVIRFVLQPDPWEPFRVKLP